MLKVCDVTVKDQLQLVPTKAHDITVGNNLDVNVKRSFHTQPYRNDFYGSLITLNGPEL